MRLFRGLLAFLLASMPLVWAQSSDASAILATMPPCALKSTKNASMTMCGAPVRSRQREFLVVNDIMGTLSGLFVLQRFAAKFFLQIPFGLDDLFVGLAMLITIPCIAINSHGLIPNGMGRDIWTVQPQQITNFGLYFYVMTILYFTLQTFLKLSLIFFYLRIFPSRGVRRALWATVIFNGLYGLIFIFITVFQCRPIHLFWTKWQNKEYLEGTCININYMTWCSGGLTIALDAWIISIPLSQLRKMNMDWKKKIGVGIMFSVGIFVTIMSILRLHAVIKLRAGAGANNATWEYTEFALWSTIEISTGIICACLPSLRVLLVRIFPKLGGSSQRKYYQHDSDNLAKANPAHNRPLQRPLGTVCQGDKTPHHSRVDPVGITCSRTYEVEFDQKDSDEAQLFYMKDLGQDGTSVKSNV
ncbi:integral membrane protein PTH11 [Fusarium heterosporum]|uniref:Integral membrane protein PTH11 n=1 Tax=Fusarium heterosporum TaxID=42747 RepID=A0A8H5WW85_FUSHE|nr:integral membrane protein PTH11 [Fusarium heterosporum]